MLIVGCGTPTTSGIGTAGTGFDTIATADGGDTASASDTAGDTGPETTVDADSTSAGTDATSTDAAGTDAAADATSDIGTSCTAGQPCDDGDPCTKGDACVGGACQGTPLDCAKDLPICKKASCVPSLGICNIEDAEGSCDDGDPCTQADGCLVGACTGFPIQGCCIPSCTGKQCGDDGCGTSCGSCKPDELCGAGSCVKASKAGETCKDALAITALPYTHVGTTSGASNDLKAPDKACYNGTLGTFGPDVVYAYTATADVTLALKLSGYDNKPAFYVVTDCADIKNSCLIGQLGFGQPTLGPAHAKVSAGSTAYIIIDADGTGGDYTLDVSTCTPSCSGKVCGSDGCGGVCGYCQKLSAYNCSSAGTCLCVPNCYQKSCGGDGCGGSCGSPCTGGKVCDDGSMAGQFTGNCVTPGQKGDTCAAAIDVVGSPFSYAGSTVGLGNQLYGWSFCDGNGTGAYYGDEAPDMVFRLGAQAAGTWLVELVEKGSNLQLYAVTDCTDPTSCVQAGYQGASLKTQLLVEAGPSKPVYVAVDGYSTQAGTFKLQATACASPADCPSATLGDTCTFPIAVDALPFSANGSLGIPSYSLPKGACGAAKELGKGGGNRAYRFIAPKAGSYTVKVVGTGGMDPIVYAATDCIALSTSCLGYVDATGDGGEEVLKVEAKAQQAIYVVVDAPSSVNGTFSVAIRGP